MAWKELEHIGERRRGSGEVAEREIRLDRLRIELRRNQPAGEQALELRSEDQQIALPAVVQRLDAKAIPGHDAPPHLDVPRHEGKFAAERLRHIEPVTLVEMWKHLGVTRAAKTMAVALEVLAELLMVVKLAVLCRPGSRWPCLVRACRGWVVLRARGARCQQGSGVPPPTGIQLLLE